MKYICFFVAFVIAMPLIAQEEAEKAVDSLYREDQFYVGLTFNLLGDRPLGIDQNGLSGGLQAGFIRDMPFNKRRNKSIGVGIGLAGDTYNQNLFIGEELDGETTIFSEVPNGVGKEINRFSYFTLQMPIQYRWRTSTPTDYSFWRVYGGIQLGYIYHFKSTFVQPQNTVIQTDIPELNRFQYGLTLSFGYGAFNFYGYYGLNTLFNEDAKIDEQITVNLQVIRLGIMFYIL